MFSYNTENIIYTSQVFFSCYHQAVSLKQTQNYLEQSFSGKSDSSEEAGHCMMQQNYLQQGMQLA